MKLIISFIHVKFCQFLQWWYSIKVAENNDEKNTVFKFRYQVYIKEIGIQDVKPNDIHENLMYDELDLDNSSITVYASRNRKVIGTLRISIWQKNNLPSDIKAKYHIDEPILKLVDTIAELRFFQIAVNYRKGILALALFNALYEACGKHSATLPDIIFCDAFIGLTPYYEKIGCYLYTKKSPLENVFLTPLALNPYDIKYFFLKKSISRYITFWHLHSIKKRFSRNIYLQKAKTYIDLIPRFPIYLTPEEKAAFRANFDSKEKCEIYDFITSILKKSVTLTIRKNTVLIKMDMVEYDMFLLIQGTVAVYINNIEVARLSPGDILGEISIFSPKHKRQADIKCLSDIEVILIPRNLLSKLENRDPKNAIKFLRILGASLSKKLLMANMRLITDDEKSVQRS